jgi:hypothetical protein
MNMQILVSNQNLNGQKDILTRYHEKDKIVMSFNSALKTKMQKLNFFYKYKLCQIAYRTPV